ncbi:filamentous hemagglutinin N-terminal domain-containing protein, partial [Candidatus Omnitrophota bacterium]
MHNILKKQITIAILMCFLFHPQLIYALPEGGSVVEGTATLDYLPDGVTLEINQTTQRMIAEWLGFSISEAELVRFIQPGASSIALNRVISGNPSYILGRIIANGRVFLINPNNIIFGVNSVVDAAGMVASTLGLDMSDADFMDPNNQVFNFAGPGGSVVNYGTLTTMSRPGGYVALLGSSVKNVGLIEANLGTVVLAGAEKMTLNLDPAGIISVVVDITQGTNRNDDGEYAAVNNTGKIVANDGKVILTAEILDSVFTSAVNNDGIIEANDINQVNGAQVLLRSNQNVELNGTIQLAKGTIDAYAEQNIIIGNPLKDLILSNFIWEYLGHAIRDYKFKEFGYYYNDGAFIIPLSIGFDIGKDATSPTSGAGLASLPDEPQGLYTVFDAGSLGIYTYFQDAALNADGLDHLDLVKLQATGSEYWWEDMFNNGDQDFDDAVIDFVSGIERLSPPPALLDAPDIFLTANQGYIKQVSGEIKANRLMLHSNTGVSGTGANGGIATQVANVSALNKSANHIRINNRGNLNIIDTSALDGLLPGVTSGHNGITNYAVGGEVNIDVDHGSGGDLNVEAPVDSYGPVIFTAEGDIIHTPAGDVTVHNPYLPPDPPTNLHSPTHLINHPYLNDGNTQVQAKWALPDNVPGYGFTGDAGGVYSMAPGSQIVTQGGDASINAVGDVSLALVDAQNGNVEVTSQTAIKDADSGQAPGDFDVIAHNIKLNAPIVGGPGDGQIDLGHPYDFSHLWDNFNSTNADASVDPYDESFDLASGDWSFTNLSHVLADGSWWFHVATIDGASKSAGGGLSLSIPDT